MKFNHDLYRKIRSVRKELGLPVACLNKQVIGYPLFNKQVFDNETQKQYTVEDIRLHWYAGWYYVLILRDNQNSHGVRFWENVNCHDPIILDSIKENKTIIQVLNEA